MIAGFKKFMSCIELNCIASFISGAYSILLVNYFWFEGSINPAGVSSVIAAMALAFTVYVAFKVKEWTMIKTNDRGFKQTEEIVNQLIELYKKINRATALIHKFRNTVDEHKISKIYSDIAKTKREIQIIINEIHGLSVSLELWSVTIDKRLEGNLYEIGDHLTYFNYEIDTILKDINYCGNKTNECVELLESCKDHFMEIFKLKHKDMFSFN